MLLRRAIAHFATCLKGSPSNLFAQLATAKVLCSLGFFEEKAGVRASHLHDAEKLVRAAIIHARSDMRRSQQQQQQQQQQQEEEPRQRQVGEGKSGADASEGGGACAGAASAAGGRAGPGPGRGAEEIDPSWFDRVEQAIGPVSVDLASSGDADFGRLGQHRRRGPLPVHTTLALILFGQACLVGQEDLEAVGAAKGSGSPVPLQRAAGRHLITALRRGEHISSRHNALAILIPLADLLRNLALGTAVVVRPAAAQAVREGAAGGEKEEEDRDTNGGDSESKGASGADGGAGGHALSGGASDDDNEGDCDAIRAVASERRAEVLFSFARDALHHARAACVAAANVMGGAREAGEMRVLDMLSSSLIASRATFACCNEIRCVGELERLTTGSRVAAGATSTASNTTSRVGAFFFGGRSSAKHAAPEQPPPGISHLVFDPRGNRLLISTTDGTIESAKVVVQRRQQSPPAAGAAGGDSPHSCVGILASATATGLRHKKIVRALCVLGSAIVSASDDRTIRVWREDAPAGDDQNNDDPQMSAAGQTAGQQQRRQHRVADRIPGVPRGSPGIIAIQNKTLALSVLDAGDSDEQLVVSAHQDGLVHIWAIGPPRTTRLATLRGHTQSVIVLDTACSSVIVSGSIDRSVRLWDVTKVLPGLYTEDRGGGADGDGDGEGEEGAGAGGGIGGDDAAAGQVPAASTTTMATAKRKRLVVSRAGRTRFQDVAYCSEPRWVWTKGWPGCGPIYAVALNPAATLCVCGTTRGMRLLDCGTGLCVQTIPCVTAGFVDSCTFGPRGQLFTGHDSGQLCVWDVSGGRAHLLRRCDPPPGAKQSRITSIALVPGVAAAATTAGELSAAGRKGAGRGDSSGGGGGLVACSTMDGRVLLFEYGEGGGSSGDDEQQAAQQQHALKLPIWTQQTLFSMLRDQT